MKRVKPTKHREARWLSTHTHSTVQIEKHVQQSTVSEINFSFALFEHLLVTICSLKTHSLQAFVHSALNTASILTKAGRSSFSHELLDLKYGLLHCRLWTCGWHGIYQRTVEKTMPFFSIKGVISYILLLLFKIFPRGSLNIFCSDKSKGSF